MLDTLLQSCQSCCRIVLALQSKPLAKAGAGAGQLMAREMPGLPQHGAPAPMGWGELSGSSSPGEGTWAQQERGKRGTKGLSQLSQKPPWGTRVGRGSTTEPRGLEQQHCPLQPLLILGDRQPHTAAGSGTHPKGPLSPSFLPENRSLLLLLFRKRHYCSG